MTELDDNQLLTEYARTQSETAFAAIVIRHVNLVYSTALRFTGNPHHAQEITQAVFIILARKGGGLRRGTLLSGWLYQTARLTAANFVKSEIRRQNREQEAYMQSTLTEPDAAWKQLAPLLDEAMGRLGETDRNAVVLRFFENKTASEIAAALELNEAAAHKRVARGLEKLRKYFLKRGVTLTAAAIAGAVGANSVSAAPVGLAMTAAAAAAKGAAVSGSALTLVKGVLKIMAWAKMKTVVVVGVATVLVATTTMAVVEDIFKHLDTDPASSAKLETLSPILIVRPTQYPTNGVGFQTPGGKSVVVNTSIEEMIRHAYGFTTPVRMILPTDLPEGQFDYLNSLKDHQREALRAELKRQFGLTAHTEIRTVSSLLLEIKDPEKLKSHLVQNGKPGNLGTFRMSRGKTNEAITGFESMQFAELLETIFQKPVFDKTGSDSLYEWKNKSEMNPGVKGDSRKDIWRIIVGELGLELVPTNMPVEMLVIEQTK
jgi:uncharacterized protein (TIGR03435 family)